MKLVTLLSRTNISLIIGKIEEMEESQGAQVEVPSNYTLTETSKEDLQEDVTNMLLNFEIKEVWLLVSLSSFLDVGIILCLAVQNSLLV